jgi:SMODS and SLOG-associating 2TM effector domain family 5
MAEAAPNARITPRVVSSIEEAMARRRAPAPVPRDAQAAGQLLHAMHTVKAARFNAAERLERKHLVSLFAMSMVSLYFVGLSVWQAVYAPQIGEAANRLVTLVSIMSSVFTLVLALIESNFDYKMKAHHLHTCALAVNDLYHELKLMGPVEPAVVQDFRRRYNETVRSCPVNHAHIDYLMARAERNVPWTEKAWAHVRCACDVYALYGLCLLIPPLVLLIWA